MRKRFLLPLIGAGLFAVALGIFFYAMHSRVHRRTALRIPAAGGQKQVSLDTLSTLPETRWTEHLKHLEASAEWERLDSDLTRLLKANQSTYDRHSFGYLHGRVKIERDEPSAAGEMLRPFLAPSHPLREVALYHAAEAEDAAREHDKASMLRRQLIFECPRSVYRDEAIEDELDALDQKPEPADVQFMQRLYPSAGAPLRRGLDVRIAERGMKGADDAAAIAKLQEILKGEIGDDAAERASSLLDQEKILPSLAPDVILLLGQSQQAHRHFERAVALLLAARERLPLKFDDITFSIGRSQFGNEHFTEALKTYLDGAARTKDARWRCTFFFHASRAAQLLGDDAQAEKLMTSAIAVPGKFPATSAALTQRIRIRVHQGKEGEAAADLAQLRRLFPKDHAVVDAALAMAVGDVARHRNDQALADLNAIPPALLTPMDRYEVDYWRGRALEDRAPSEALAQYLQVLGATEPTHFAYFARERLAAALLKPEVARQLDARRKAADALIASGHAAQARSAATDVVLLNAVVEKGDLDRLRLVYATEEPYKTILALAVRPLPSLPVDEKDTAGLLMALGLFDDAAGSIVSRYPLRPLSSALTQSLALNYGAASKPSIYAIEVLMKSVPADFVPALLPQVVLQLLYPRYYDREIAEDSTKYKADPRLVLSIMREESRFNARAKSVAAARGLLQFIITTARDVGRDLGLVNIEAQDLYDPRIIIQLGGKYIGTLLGEFGGNRYATAAAYNAGPAQTRLWLKLAPAPGNDFFLSSINFDETKNYVRKVMNSYARYGEIYDRMPPVGGTHAEP